MCGMNQTWTRVNYILSGVRDVFGGTDVLGTLQKETSGNLMWDEMQMYPTITSPEKSFLSAN